MGTKNDFGYSPLARLGNFPKGDLSLLGTQPSSTLLRSAVAPDPLRVRPLEQHMVPRHVERRSAKTLHLKVLLDDATRKAYNPMLAMRVITIISQDTRESINDSIKAACHISYRDAITLEAPRGYEMQPLYENFSHDMTVYVRIILLPASRPSPSFRSSKPAERPVDTVDPELLQDVTAWLRSLRLHKFTDNLKDLQWYDLIQLNNKDLEARGVDAPGARKKFLKVFDQVKSRQRAEQQGFWNCTWERCLGLGYESSSAQLQHVMRAHIEPQISSTAGWYCGWQGCSVDSTFPSYATLRTHVSRHLYAFEYLAGSGDTLAGPDDTNESKKSPEAVTVSDSETVQESVDQAPCGMYVHYTISEDRSGATDHISTLLARLGAREARSLPPQQQASAGVEPATAEPG